MPLELVKSMFTDILADVFGDERERTADGLLTKTRQNIVVVSSNILLTAAGLDKPMCHIYIKKVVAGRQATS